MGERIRAHDWSASPVAPIETWPYSLRTAVGMILHSKFPAYILWGRELTTFYNDAYRPILGTKPEALGQPFSKVWPETWDMTGAIAGRALAGQASYFEDLPLTLERNGSPEQTWWTFSYSPIHNEVGHIVGVLGIVHETTAKVRGEQRLEFLVRLNDCLRNLTEPAEIISAAQEMLGEHLGTNRAGYGEVEETGRYFTTESNWTDGTVAQHIGTHDLAAFGPEIHGALKRGETLVVIDVRKDARTNSPESLAAFSFLEMASVITVSLIKRGRMVAALYVHNRAPRLWSESEIKLVEDVAERTWDAVERARTEAALRKSEERLQLALEASIAVGAWDWDLKSGLIYADGRFAGLYGVDSAQAVAGAPLATFLKGIHPDDLANVEHAIQHAIATGALLDAEYRTIDTQGQIHWVLARGRCYRVGGIPVRFPGIVVDVTERKKAEEHRELLIHELNHRVKNTLATVQSIASQTLRNADTLTGARPALEERLFALSRVHDVLTRESWESAGLTEIVSQALAPYRHDRENRLSMGGPHVRLSPRMALSIALALQELATNAVKYGALSNATGEVHIEWSVRQDEGGPRLHLAWTESGGPLVEPPKHRGFGTRLIERSLAQDLNGQVEFRFVPTGVVCTVDAPLA
jgi:PAS domain S-box-containing protein